MSRYGADYKVARSTGVCAATGEPLEPGSTCVATLCERREDEGLDRLDYSLAAWERGDRPEGLFSYWRTSVPRPEDRRRLLVDDEVLMDVFNRLADDDRPRRVAFRFVLGLVLMRKRRLKYLGRTGDGKDESWLLAVRGGGSDAPPIRVVNPHLTDEDVREITDQLGEVFQGDL